MCDQLSHFHLLLSSQKFLCTLGPVYMEASFPASRVSRQGEIINCQCLRVAGKLGQTGFNSGMLT